jgi:drug/metabolite transporter (DMT)-like permease
MLVAFVTNGIGPFGLKILTEKHLDQYESQYLVFWYLGGLLLALLAFGLRWFRLSRWEILFGIAMGFGSLGGQFFTGKALAVGIPGHIAFPITTGGSLFLVALAGILVFKERVGPYGLAGLIIGILSLIVLSLG